MKAFVGVVPSCLLTCLLTLTSLVAFAQDTATEKTDRQIVIIPTPVHFVGPKGVDILVSADAYWVFPGDESIRLEMIDGDVRHDIPAVPASHDDQLDADIAVSVAGSDEKPDSHTIYYLFADGRQLSIKGSYSGIASRGLFSDARQEAERVRRLAAVRAKQRAESAAREAREKAQQAAQAAADKASAIKEAADRELKIRARNARAMAYFNAQGIEELKKQKALLEAAKAALKQADDMNLRQRLDGLSVQSRGSDMSMIPPAQALALLDEYRATPAVRAFERSATEANYHSVGLTVGCSASAGLVHGVGVSLAQGYAWSPRKGDIFEFREASINHAGVEASASCDTTLGAWRPEPKDIRGGSLGFSADVHVIAGVGVGFSFDTDYSGFTQPDGDIYGYGAGSRASFAWDNREHVSFSGVTVNIGIGVGASIGSAEAGDSYVRMLRSTDPWFGIKYVDFARGAVLIQNLGNAAGSLDGYTLLRIDGDQTVFDLNGLPEQAAQPGMTKRDPDTGVWVDVGDLDAAQGGFALFNSAAHSADTIIDYVAWGDDPDYQSPVIDYAKTAFINWGVCKIPDPANTTGIGATWAPNYGASGSEWVRLNGEEKTGKCGITLFPGHAFFNR